MLYSYGYTHLSWPHTSQQLFFSAELLVGGTRWMYGKRFGIAHVGEVRDELQGIDYGFGFFSASFEFKTQYASESIAQVLIGAIVIGRGLQTGIVDKFYFGQFFQPSCNLQCIVHGALHTQRKGL
jgi:hypothetical protein